MLLRVIQVYCFWDISHLFFLSVWPIFHFCFSAVRVGGSQTYVPTRAGEEGGWRNGCRNARNSWSLFECWRRRLQELDTYVYFEVSICYVYMQCSKLYHECYERLQNFSIAVTYIQYDCHSCLFLNAYYNAFVQKVGTQLSHVMAIWDYFIKVGLCVCWACYS